MEQAFDQTEGGDAGEAIRAKYHLAQSLPDPLPVEPMTLASSWMSEARDISGQPNPNAMALATSDASGRVSCRIVLCKRVEAAGGYVVFFTNYESRKGKALIEHPRAAVVFHWDLLDRQIRIEGPVVKSPGDESDAYFASRPLESQIGAWASDQSRPIESPVAMLLKVEEVVSRFGADFSGTRRGARVEVPRPAHWGGFRLWAERVELWVGGPGRIHDRAEWVRILSPGRGEAEFTGGAWTTTRLQP